MATLIKIIDTHVANEGVRLRPEPDHKRAGTAPDHEFKAIRSGCMRGNDRYGSNGSASAGIFTVLQVPEAEEQSYSDFITYNYGPKHERQHSQSVRRPHISYYGSR